MNRLAIVVIISVCLLSCKAQPKKALTQAEITAKADSIVAFRAEEIRRQAEEDLDRRMAIEVKVKADSLIQICRQQGQQLLQEATQPDNTTPGPSNQP